MEITKLSSSSSKKLLFGIFLSNVEWMIIVPIKAINNDDAIDIYEFDLKAYTKVLSISIFTADCVSIDNTISSLLYLFISDKFNIIFSFKWSC